MKRKSIATSSLVVPLALFLSALFSAPAATTPPKVVFAGDSVTYGWTSVFAANPNWINQGAPGSRSRLRVSPNVEGWRGGPSCSSESWRRKL
jgi:hypothetical protein